MLTSADIPFWLLLPIGFFALAGLWLLVIVPLTSGVMYRRRQRSLHKLDEKLEFGLSNYAVARRRDWLDRLLGDQQVMAEIERVATGNGTSIEEVQVRARGIAEEIVPFFNVLLYFRFGYWVARWLLRTMYWISTRYSDQGALADIGRDSCVVLVSNHRSSLDPFLLIYLASRRSAISYSAGEWALGWPIRYLLHAIGFYIIRRDGSGDNLYRTLLERYIWLAASHCVPQGLFLEGELSRDGEMQPLRLGLLSYLLKAQGEGSCRDIVFVPVGLGYDRVPEDRTLVEHQTEGFRKKGGLYPLLSLVRFMILVVPRMIGLGKPYGKAMVNYGRPLSLSRWLKTTGQSLDPAEPQLRRETVASLGETLTESIESLIPVLPVSLVAQVLLQTPGGISELQLKRDALALAERLREASVTVALDVNEEERALSQAMYLLLKRRQLELASDGRLLPMPDAGPLLLYYRNAIPASFR